jgi:hypothetical protein
MGFKGRTQTRQVFEEQGTRGSTSKRIGTEKRRHGIAENSLIIKLIQQKAVLSNGMAFFMPRVL